MNLKLKLFVLSFFLTSVMVIAQQINGKIIDENGTPLPYVNVLEKGTSNGVSTNEQGEFEINVGRIPVTLEFSLIGFSTLEKTIYKDNSLVEIVLKEGLELDEVVVIGTRNQNRTAIDSPVPIDIIDMAELVETSPQVNLNQILNFVAPSFTSNTQTISDGTDHIDPASLRGLGPDQVLVLINGKRRHNSSLVNVNGTFGRGSVGTDLNAIPAAAIKRLEVLRDGAAAQYGSDAIAGVINIVLNESVNELFLNVTTGANFSKNSNSQTGGVDGENINISASYGLPLGEKGGFVNFTGDFDFREDYNRMKEWEESIFNGYNAVERFANTTNYDITKLLSLGSIPQEDSNPAMPYIMTADELSIFNDLQGFANLAGYATPSTGSDIEKFRALRTSLGADATSSELAARNLNRTDFNMRVGQSKVRGGRFFANFKLPLDENGTELYSFAGFSSRTGNSAGFYRLPSQSRTFTPAYNNGFLPEINSAITDQSVSMGIKGKINEWNVDFSNTYGKNAFLYTIGNTFNASQGNASPTTFDAGGFSFMQNTVNLDINKFYEDTFEGLSVAFGAEYRVENYEIEAGEEASYSQYTAEGQVITLASQTPLLDFFGRKRPGGSQVFPGFGPKNELLRGRNSIAGYVDLDATFSDAFSATFATRFENYSDFGSTLNFKLATILKASDNFRIRASFNTGFRAPSLHQLNFNSTSTIFDQKGDPQEVGTFANDSRAANLLGIPKLKEETSKSFSAGFTAKLPESKLTFTLDGYFVAIDDRVVYTGQFRGPGTDTELDRLLAQANASRASFFANAIDTESMGLDFVITHKANIGSNSRLKSDLSATLSQTKQVGDIKASDVLRNAGLVDTYFPQDSRIYLEKAVPRTKLNLTNSFTSGKYNIFLRNVYFGKVTEATSNINRQQEFSAKVVTDLSFGYKATDNLTFTVGANNLLDIYPDRAAQDLELNTDGDQNNRSSGRFDWSRRSQQFGIGGRFLFARVSLNLK